MGSLSPWHWLILLAVVVILFGAKKLPDAARSLGKSMRIFKSEIREMQNEGKTDQAGTPVQPSLQVPSERMDFPVTGPTVQNQNDARPA